MENELAAEVDRLSREAKELAHELGGGWRLEQGIMPVVVLTTVEAKRLAERLAGQEQNLDWHINQARFHVQAALHLVFDMQMRSSPLTLAEKKRLEDAQSALEGVQASK